MKISKNSRGTWEAYVYLGTDETGRKMKKHLTAKSKSELLDEVEKIKAVVDNDNISSMDMTVRDCVTGYIERRKRNGSCSPKTIKEYIQYRDHVFYDLWDVKVRNLNDRILQKAIDNASVGHSPKSVQNWWGLYKASISFYNKRFDPRVELPRIQRKRLEMPSQDALKDMFRTIDNTPIEIPVMLACTCGLRRGEICALDLNKDIDYVNNTIRITKDMVQAPDHTWVIKDHPKTDAGNRTLPCSQVLIDKLAALRDKGGKMMTPNALSKAWQRLKKKCDLPCSFHGLRHYFVSVMESKGISWTYQKQLMGHTTNSMLNKYQEYLRETTVQVNKDLQSHFDSLLSK